MKIYEPTPNQIEGALKHAEEEAREGELNAGTFLAVEVRRLRAAVRRLLEREKALARIAEAAEYADTMDWRGRRKLANAARALAALSALNPGEKK